MKPSSGSLSGLGKRAVTTSNVSGQRAALLVIDGNQTTCEIALVDNRGGYVAASCIKYKGDRVDFSLKYEAYIYNGPGAAPARYKIEQIDAHFAYNQTTYANNIAVVQFNKAEKSLWYSVIAKFSFEWNDRYYVRRTLNNVKDMDWNDPAVKPQLKDSDGCSDASELYRNNPDGLYCISGSTPSIYNKTCQVPYSSMYGVIQPSDLGMAALYSHSAVYGKDMCGGSRKFHYYTRIANYNFWASQVLGYSISVVTHANNSYIPPTTFALNGTKTPSSPDITIFSGDLYPRQGAIPPSSSNSEPSATPTGTSGASSVPSNTPTPTPTSSSNSAHPANSNSASGGMTRTAIIALAVAVPLGTILATVGLFFLYRWWRKRHNELTWNTNQNHRQIINEIGGATNRESELPPYERTAPTQQPEQILDSKS
ncbi:hypothetical protein GGI12_001839 [Dipsacomyces acuminosporus]|nr:hypothetical protein GGI12_001839 [Dipsacomyces acuminosporus]